MEEAETRRDREVRRELQAVVDKANTEKDEYKDLFLKVSIIGVMLCVYICVSVCLPPSS